MQKNFVRTFFHYKELCIRKYLRVRKKKEPQYQNLMPENLRFCTFFKNTLLPRHLTSKFTYLMTFKESDLLTGKFLTSKNKIILRIIMRIYLLVLFVFLYQYMSEEQRVRDSYSADMWKKLYSLTTFNFFNSTYFNMYYYNNRYIQKLTKSFMLDVKKKNTFIYSYNFYLLSQLKIFEVLFNFEDYKYEEDKILYKTHKYASGLDLYAKTKVKRYKKMHLDLFDYLKKKNRIRFISKYLKRVDWLMKASWNNIERDEDDEVTLKKLKKKKNIKNHLEFQSNLFFGYIIYDIALNQILEINNNKLFLNYFNFDFFDKMAWTFEEEKRKKETVQKPLYPYFLTSLYYNYYVTSKTEKQINNPNNTFIKKILYTDYKNVDSNLALEDDSLIPPFDGKSHILDIKYFGIKIPFTFFLLRTWYWIYYRRARYNFYIRGDFFFQEHFSKIQYFIWVNNIITAGRSVAKYSTYQTQKLFTIYTLKSYVEMNLFNDWFYFYQSYRVKFKNALNLNKKQHQLSFSLLLNNNYIQNVLNIKNENNKSGSNLYRKSLFIFFIYYASLYHHRYEVFNAYTLFMKTAVTRFEPEFKLGRLSFADYNSMLNKVFLIPLDQKRLIHYLEKKLLWEHFFNLYLSFNSLNFYFLNDFFNFTNQIEYIKYFKILNFYEKIFYIMFLLIDPFFFKYFWKRCFPKKWHKLRGVQHHVLCQIIVMHIILPFKKRKSKFMKFNVPAYDFIMHYLRWKIDTGNFFLKNKRNNDIIAQEAIMINTIYKQRFLELVKQINFLLRLPKFDMQRKFYYCYNYYLAIFKNYFFDLLENNIEYTLIFFFLNNKKYIDLALISRNSFIKMIYSTFIYRHYIYNIWLESRFYDDWFINWNKRIFWIYKNFLDHEGPRFYSKRGDIV